MLVSIMLESYFCNHAVFIRLVLQVKVKQRDRYMQRKSQKKHKIKRKKAMRKGIVRGR